MQKAWEVQIRRERRAGEIRDLDGDFPGRGKKAAAKIEGAWVKKKNRLNRQQEVKVSKRLERRNGG